MDLIHGANLEQDLSDTLALTGQLPSTHSLSPHLPHTPLIPRVRPGITAMTCSASDGIVRYPTSTYSISPINVAPAPGKS